MAVGDLPKIISSITGILCRMKLTKFTHACVRLERAGSVMVIDPGSFSPPGELEEVLSGATAILITHEHFDHLDAGKVVAALESTADLHLWAPDGVAGSLRGQLSDAAVTRVHIALPETAFTAAGFAVRTFGSQHALIHAHIPMVANLGYLIEDAVYHPGDSFVVPHGARVEALLVPVHAPWSKTAEVIDFVIGVRAPRAFPIHDALLNETGLKLVEGHVGRLGGHYGTQFEHLSPGQSIEL